MAMENKNDDSKYEDEDVGKKAQNPINITRLSIVIDATGSMSATINQCKVVIQKSMPKLVNFLKENNMSSESFEIQFIAYRNYNAPAEEILEFCPFTSNENELSNFIHSVKPSYGWGDEAVEIGFKQLNRQQKKPHIVILIADAPSQSTEDILRKKQERGKEYWQKAQDGFYTDSDWREEASKFMKENGDSNIHCFYLKNSAKDNFAEIAKIGKGKSMYLDVKDQEKSISLLQGVLSETILFKMSNGNMDIVAQFRKENQNLTPFL